MLLPMKRPLLIAGAVILVGIAYYLLSPLWRTSTLDEASPVAERAQSSMAPEKQWALESMPPEKQRAFERAMERVKDERMEKAETMPAAAKVVAQAPFIAHAHDVEGKALLIQRGDVFTVRFEDFETINGPNLHIYLAADLEGNDYVDLGPLRATHGNVNYPVPAGTDTAKYRHVLVWCVPFGILFSAASL